MTIYNAFNHDDTIPSDQDMRMYGYDIAAEGTAAANFVKVAGNCTATIYKQNDRCTVTVAVKPNVVGPFEGALVSTARLKTGVNEGGQDVYQVFKVANMTLRGLGQGGELAVVFVDVHGDAGVRGDQSPPPVHAGLERGRGAGRRAAGAPDAGPVPAGEPPGERAGQLLDRCRPPVR